MKPLKFYIEDWILFLKYYFLDFINEIKTVIKTKSFWIIGLVLLFFYILIKYRINKSKLIMFAFLSATVLFFYLEKLRSGGLYRHKYRQEYKQRIIEDLKKNDNKGD